MIRHHLGAVLRERGTTVAALHRATGVSCTTLYRLAHGTAARVDLATLDAVCAALGVGVGELLVYVGPPPSRRGAQPRNPVQE